VELAIFVAASRELYTAHSLHRQFVWANAVLGADECTCPTLVSLAGGDTLVNTPMISDYLTQQQEMRSRDETNTQRLEVVQFHRFHHAQILFSPSAQDRLVGMLHALQKTSESSTQRHWVMTPIGTPRQ
jgi:hypothetical protein